MDHFVKSHKQQDEEKIRVISEKEITSIVLFFSFTSVITFIYQLLCGR